MEWIEPLLAGSGPCEIDLGLQLGGKAGFRGQILLPPILQPGLHVLESLQYPARHSFRHDVHVLQGLQTLADEHEILSERSLSDDEWLQRSQELHGKAYFKRRIE